MNEILGRLELDIQTGQENPWAFIDEDCITREIPTSVLFPGQTVMDPYVTLSRRVGVVQDTLDTKGNIVATAKPGDAANLLVLWDDDELELRDNYTVVYERYNSGLITLLNGDELTIYNEPSRESVLFKGIVKLELIDIVKPIDQDYEEWFEWFLTERPARLRRETGFNHREAKTPKQIRRKRP